MSGEFKRTYFALLFPSIVSFIFICLARAYDILLIGSFNFLKILAPSIFISSVICALALPFFYHMAFTQRLWDQDWISKKEWLRFERKTIYIAMVTPYLAVAAYFFNFPRFYLYGTILMGLYAVYHYYPSEKRITLERYIFRVK